ncbi:MAG: GIY-YIG nuclease family protein [Balneolaceae bacterium]|nr:GIY-YIG nuclease family protein [Balneolaceae bacterium]
MKYTVYTLYSPDYDKIYIGYTSDLDSRMRSHNEKGTKGWTVKYRPWKLVFTEKFETKGEAMKREKELKSLRGRVYVWVKVNLSSSNKWNTKIYDRGKSLSYSDKQARMLSDHK